MCSTDLISEKHVSGVLLAVSDICSQNHFPDKAINHTQNSSPMGTRGHQRANINPLSFTHTLKVRRWGRHRWMTAKNNGCQQTQTQKQGAFHMQNPLRIRPTDKEHGMCLCAQLSTRHNVCSDTLGFSSTGQVYLQQSVLFWKAWGGLCTH